MSPVSRPFVPALAAVLSLLASTQLQSQVKGGATVTGVFVGRGGKPMAKAVTDDKGQFQFTGVAPGTYTVVYQPSGTGGAFPPEISIRAFSATTRSTAPMLRGTEIETTGQRAWGQFILLKGHTFYSEGADMKIWNATVRRAPLGPYLEIRKGVIWRQRLDGKSPVRFDAWSY
ncbi:MAG: carboxypeptidase regulatory-like domain-containing protein [Acidobacteria bacterium]|nr:carboxypeptidase regulatory-like domain-containing protein [Acidobacteriota bacterium]